MYLWLRSYILEFRYSLHSYSLQRRILLHSCMLFRWLVLLSISSLKIGPVQESKMPWLESVEVLRSELHGQFLPYPFWLSLRVVTSKLLTQWLFWASWLLLSWPFMFRYQRKSHTPGIFGRDLKDEKHVFLKFYLSILCITFW